MMHSPSVSTPSPQALASASPTDLLDEGWPTLDELSLRYLHRVIAHAKGNKTKAAELLGIDRRTVSRILGKVDKNGKTPTMQTGNRK
jgi:Fis family transcriptional regulator, factor for inversion stimulation protein